MQPSGTADVPKFLAWLREHEWNPDSALSFQNNIRSFPALVRQYENSTGLWVPECSTVEMPVTPEVATLLARAYASANRKVLYSFVFICAAFVAVCTFGNYLADPKADLAVPAAIAAGFACVGYAGAWMAWVQPIWTDIQGKSFLRATGPVQIAVPTGKYSSGPVGRLADRRVLLGFSGGLEELRNLGWGTVDYSPRGHVILRAWDHAGRSVYEAS